LLDWLRTHPNALEEEAATNNHGTWYDLQAGRYAIFVGRSNLACQIMQLAPQRRIATQIQPDGSLPEELSRADPFHYELYNLRAFFGLASLARAVDIDLFNYQTADGRGIRKALDFMVPYVSPSVTWPYPQTKPVSRTDFIGLLRQAAMAYRAPAYETSLQVYFSGLQSNLIQVQHPR
jgi:Alginate lyase